MKLTAENFAELCPDCFVEYVPKRDKDGKTSGGISCVGDSPARDAEEELHRGMEKNYDIQRAKKVGCKGAVEICAWLNGRRLI